MLIWFALTGLTYCFGVVCVKLFVVGGSRNVLVSYLLLISDDGRLEFVTTWLFDGIQVALVALRVLVWVTCFRVCLLIMWLLFGGYLLRMDLRVEWFGYYFVYVYLLVDIFVGGIVLGCL